MKPAVVVHMLDTSGSIDTPQRELADTEATAIESWLRGRSSQLVTRLVVFDANAREVERCDFTTIADTGGTRISSALVRCAEIVEADYPPTEWDAFAVLFTDGDNWSFEDTTECVRLVRDRLLPRLVAFGLAQLETPYGEGQLIHDFEEAFATEARVVSKWLGKERRFEGAFRERVEALGIAAPPAAAKKKRAHGGAKRGARTKSRPRS